MYANGEKQQSSRPNVIFGAEWKGPFVSEKFGSSISRRQRVGFHGSMAYAGDLVNHGGERTGGFP